jgi:two-component system NtrC family sensor kinase
MAAEVVKVLLTEDEPSFAELVHEMLSDSDQASFKMDLASDLKSGLASLAAEKYDVVLQDLHLPDSLGLDTIRAVRKHAPHIAIVAMTGLDEETLAQDALIAGAQDFFIKTELNPKLLARVIRYAIDRRSFDLQLEKHAQELEARVKERTRQLQAAKDQWEKTFDAVPDLIAIIDKNHKIIKANKAMAEAAGSTPQDLVGRSCHQVMHGADSPIADCPHKRLLQDGAEHVQEIHEHSLGQDLLISTSPLSDENGQLIGSVHVARDISLIKETQRSVGESERLHRTFMDNLPDPTVVYDNEGKVIFSNAAFERVFGWSLDEVKNRKVDFVPPEEMLETNEGIKQMMRGEPGVNVETHRLTKDGRTLDILLSTAPLISADNKRTGNIVNLRDITAVRQAKAAQRATEQKFQELVESMNEGLTMADPTGRITYTNAKFCEMLGYPAGEIAGMLFTDLLDENSREYFTKQWERRHTGVEHKYEVVLNKKDGGSIFVIVSPKIIRDSDGKMTSSLAIMTDMTERKNLESQLIQSQKLESIGQLAAGIAHEINTPTQYVSSNTGFLKEAFTDILQLLNAHMRLIARLEKAGLEQESVAQLRRLAEELDFDFLAEEVPRALSANTEGLERIAKIVLSIKEFAHPGQEEKQPADINKAIKNTITVARNEWKYVAEVVTDLDPDLPPVPCVVGELNQVVLNLIVNAAHAIADVMDESVEKRGLITITTRQRDGLAEISVADNGSGIPEEIRNRIFDPFFTTKEPGKGTGQGLAIAYRAVVDNHKGKIALESNEGEGAKFIIRLPLSSKGEE